MPGSLQALVQNQQALRSHIKKQVHDTHIREKAVPSGEHLIIWDGVKTGIFPFALGRKQKTAILHIGIFLIAFRVSHLVFYPYQPAYRLPQALVEIQKKVTSFFIKRSYIVGIILKERRILISGKQGLPMRSAPIAMPAYPHILYRCARSCLLYGYT